MVVTYPLHLFEGFGIELEYMIVDQETFNVAPIADVLLKTSDGVYMNEIEHGTLAWSNELVLHVIELKTKEPADDLVSLPFMFQKSIRKINATLKSHNACLMPTAAHPFMDPFSETRIWPHHQNDIYRTYNRIFDCCGHGWSNLQSIHINLPFGNDEEFRRLHTAIRLLLPIMPALTSSSPIIEGKTTGFMDTRLEYYRNNQANIPTITGKVIPEPVTSIHEYQNKIHKTIYRDIAPYDPDNILQEEWLNSRGAIARFERGAIEIRILDIQECPLADLAIAHIIIETLKALVNERWTSYENQIAWSENYLSNILLDTIKNGSKSVLIDSAYLAQCGITHRNSLSAREAWHFIVEDLLPFKNSRNELFRAPLEVILDHGTLSERILKEVGNKPDRDSIMYVYRKLVQNLEENKMFKPT